MTKSDAEWLQRELLTLFEEAPATAVSVGLMRRGSEWGITIRSQDPDVDAQTIGQVTAR